jgi:hypothetical protein
MKFEFKVKTKDTHEMYSAFVEDNLYFALKDDIDEPTNHAIKYCLPMEQFWNIFEPVPLYIHDYYFTDILKDYLANKRDEWEYEELTCVICTNSKGEDYVYVFDKDGGCRKLNTTGKLDRRDVEYIIDVSC